MNSVEQNIPSGKVDFSPLAERVTRSDVQAFKQRQKQTKSDKRSWWIYYAVIGAFTSLFLILSTIAAHQNGGFMWFVPVFIGVLAWALIYFIPNAKYRKLAKLDKFASANDLELIYDISNPQYSGMIFDEGNSRNIAEALRFPEGYEIGNYTYTTGSGDNRRTATWTYAKVTLARKLPHMVLDARSNNFLGLSNLPDVYKSKQELKLEGDFNKYFTLYAPGGYERDALYVFTPDVMAALIDNAAKYDLEVVDDTLYVYPTEDMELTSAEQLKPLLAVVTKLQEELGKQTTHYADERVASYASNEVGDGGKRLKTRVNYVVIGIGLLIFAAQFGSMFWEPAAYLWLILALLIPIVVVGTLIFVVIKVLVSKLSR